MKVRLTLDDQVDAEVIAALRNRAKGGSISKTLYAIILEWVFLKSLHDAGAVSSYSNCAKIKENQNTNGVSNNLAEALDSINDEW